eukprot:gene2926-4765_t
MAELATSLTKHYSNTISRIIHAEENPAQKNYEEYLAKRDTTQSTTSRYSTYSQQTNDQLLSPRDELSERVYESNFDIKPNLKPMNLGDMYDDILINIYSFFDEKELVKAGQICKNWRKVSANDELWESYYFRKKWRFKTVKQEKKKFKESYMKNCEYNYELRFKLNDSKFNLRKYEKISTTSRCFYGCLFPSLFFLGILFMTIISILLLDGSIPSRPEFIWPIVGIFLILCILSFIFVVSCLLIDPCLFELFKRRYYKLSVSEEISAPEYPKKSKFQLSLSVNFVIWGVFWIPLSIICFTMKSLLFSNFPSLPISLFLIPIYLNTALFAIVPFIFCFFRTVRKKKFFFSFWIYLVMLAINIYVSIQCLFVGFQLDNVYHSQNLYWTATLIPTWIFLFLCFLISCPLCFLVFFSEYTLNLFGFSTILTCSGCFLIPLVGFLIPFSLRLDNVFGGSFWFTFIPCFIFEIISAIGLFISNLIACKFFGYFSKTEWN